MSKAVLFDLDGTLLPLDMKEFILIYISSITPYFSSKIASLNFVSSLWKATNAMMESTDAELTNQEVFIKEFIQTSGLKKQEVLKIMDKYYKQEFPKLKKYIRYSPIARQVVQAAIQRGFKVVIATQPVFPKAGTLERMKWAKIDDLPIHGVTVYENSHFCKPRLEYYHEIVKKLGIHPERCIMVGNDMQEDMVASTMGMRTYWMDNRYRIDKGKPRYRIDQEGNLSDLLRDISRGAGIFHPIEF